MTRIPDAISRTMNQFTDDPRTLFARRREVADAIERIGRALDR